MKKYNYLMQRLRQWWFEKQTGIPTPTWRDLEERNYLTLDGIKSWKDLTLEDKL